MVLDIWISEFKAFPIKKYWVWLLSQVAIVIALVLLPPANMAFGVHGDKPLAHELGQDFKKYDIQIRSEEMLLSKVGLYH